MWGCCYTSTGLKLYAIIPAYIYSSYAFECLILKIMLVYSLLRIDDGHRVVLKSISDGVDCQHDYINATYIDVRNTIQKFHWWKQYELDVSVCYLIIVNRLYCAAPVYLSL